MTQESVYSYYVYTTAESGYDPIKAYGVLRSGRSGHRIHAKRKHACLCSPVFPIEPSGYMEIISLGKGADE